MRFLRPNVRVMETARLVILLGTENKFVPRRDKMDREMRGYARRLSREMRKIL